MTIKPLEQLYDIRVMPELERFPVLLNRWGFTLAQFCDSGFEPGQEAGT
ncbi:hypothetical protein GGQ96_003102, partial [Sphingomonas abaci]|nr:hypothetical protein [Sphingomonas abaci]